MRPFPDRVPRAVSAVRVPRRDCSGADRGRTSRSGVGSSRRSTAGPSRHSTARLSRRSHAGPRRGVRRPPRRPSWAPKRCSLRCGLTPPGRGRRARRGTTRAARLRAGPRRCQTVCGLRRTSTVPCWRFVREPRGVKRSRRTGRSTPSCRPVEGWSCSRGRDSRDRYATSRARGVAQVDVFPEPPPVDARWSGLADAPLSGPAYAPLSEPAGAPSSSRGWNPRCGSAACRPRAAGSSAFPG